jgi:phosphonopyruvate decarboxylase
MINPENFAKALRNAEISFVTGVPDSLLKDICAYITTTFPANQHLIATNEGSAIGLAIGHYLASKNPALVYMQNSGLGNAANPLSSLADPLIYGIPMLLMIGWRGEISDNGIQLHDEPQHVKQGQITLQQLDLLGIPYRLLDADTEEIEVLINELRILAVSRSGPVALVVRKQTFSPYKLPIQARAQPLPTREEAISQIAQHLPKDIPIISTTGMASRELFEYRKHAQTNHSRDFLTVGGMGHASQIATGIAITMPGHKVACLDGDGAMLMHLGGLALSARQENIIHIVINNGAHDSVGGQPTLALELNLCHIAHTLGYSWTKQVNNLAEIPDALKQALASGSSVFLEILCQTGSRSDLGRPNISPIENKANFMGFLQEYLND